MTFLSDKTAKVYVAGHRGMVGSAIVRALEAAGFGMPDKRYGQEVMACVALKPGAACTETELAGLLESRLGSFKSPKRIFFMDDLPKGPSGKIQRLKLPDMVQQEPG